MSLVHEHLAVVFESDTCCLVATDLHETQDMTSKSDIIFLNTEVGGLIEYGW